MSKNKSKESSEFKASGVRLKRIAIVFSGGFFLFLLWVIFSADTGRESVFLQFTQSIPYGDKLGHFMLFGILTFGMNIATGFRMSPVRIFKYRIYRGTFWVSIFVFFEEISQGFISTRSMDWKDLVADACGILFFTLLSARISRGQRRRT